MPSRAYQWRRRLRQAGKAVVHGSRPRRWRRKQGRWGCVRVRRSGWHCEFPANVPTRKMHRGYTSSSTTAPTPTSSTSCVPPSAWSTQPSYSCSSSAAWSVARHGSTTGILSAHAPRCRFSPCTCAYLLLLFVASCSLATAAAPLCTIAHPAICSSFLSPLVDNPVQNYNLFMSTCV
jgi:hypothetical protein